MSQSIMTATNLVGGSIRTLGDAYKMGIFKEHIDHPNNLVMVRPQYPGLKLVSDEDPHNITQAAVMIIPVDEKVHSYSMITIPSAPSDYYSFCLSTTDPTNPTGLRFVFINLTEDTMIRFSVSIDEDPLIVVACGPGRLAKQAGTSDEKSSPIIITSTGLNVTNNPSVMNKLSKLKSLKMTITMDLSVGSEERVVFKNHLAHFAANSTMWINRQPSQQQQRTSFVRSPSKAAVTMKYGHHDLPNHDLETDGGGRSLYDNEAVAAAAAAEEEEDEEEEDDDEAEEDGAGRDDEEVIDGPYDLVDRMSAAHPRTRRGPPPVAKYRNGRGGGDACTVGRGRGTVPKMSYDTINFRANFRPKGVCVKFIKFKHFKHAILRLTSGDPDDTRFFCRCRGNLFYNMDATESIERMCCECANTQNKKDALIAALHALMQERGLINRWS